MDNLINTHTHIHTHYLLFVLYFMFKRAPLYFMDPACIIITILFNSRINVWCFLIRFSFEIKTYIIIMYIIRIMLRYGVQFLTSIFVLIIRVRPGKIILCCHVMKLKTCVFIFIRKKPPNALLFRWFARGIHWKKK